MRRFPYKLRVSRALVLGSLCVALVLMSGMIQAAHFHADAQQDHDCALCLTVHSVAQAAATIELDFSSRAVEALPVKETITRARAAVYFRLVSRPPPASSSLHA